MAHHFPLPYHHAAQMPEQQPYRMAAAAAAAGYYHDNRMTSNPPPPAGELGGGWMEQTDGGGKFQLKRRRRCGQCGPCQVKDNCNKCQYCLRKDILKQACVLRKCVYLRKPVPHSRPEVTITTTTGGGGGGGGKSSSSEGVERGKGDAGGGGRSSSCSSSTNQDSPHKPPSSTPSALPTPPTTTTTKPVVPVNPLAVAAAAAVVQSAELSSCQVTKTPSFAVPGNNKAVGDALRTNGVPVNTAAGDSMRANGLNANERMDAGNNPMRASGFSVNKAVGESGGMPVNKGMGDGATRSNGLPPVNKGVCDPLRTSALEQHHSAMLDAASALNSCRMTYMSDARGGMEAGGRAPGQVLGPGASGTNCAAGFGMGGTIPTSPACAMTKDFPTLPQREQFRAPTDQWGSVPYAYSHPTPWAAPHVSYGVPSGGSYYPNALGSSCQLGMTGPANHFAAASQPSFHCAVPFAHPDFSTHTNFHAASASAVQSTMTGAPFYPPPMQIPSTLPNFPSFSQLPSSAGPHSSYTAAAARPPVYPGSFYSSFRPSYEPQIYHVQAPAPAFPFSRPHRPLPDCSSSGQCVSGKHNETCLSGKHNEACLSGKHNEAESLSSSGHCILGKHNETDRHSELERHNESHRHGEDIRVKDVERVQKPHTVPCSKKRACDRISRNSASCLCTEKVSGQKCDEQKEGGHKTDWTAMTKMECSKQQLSGHDSSGDIDDLLHLLKQVTGRRHCDTGNCDDFKMFTSFRSDECVDRDASDGTNISDQTLTKAGSRSDSVGACEHIWKRPRKRHQNCKKMQIAVRDFCKSGCTMFKMQTHQKCESDHLHQFDQNFVGCKTSQSHSVRSTCTHEQQTTNGNALPWQQTACGKYRQHKSASRLMDTASADNARVMERISQSAKDEVVFVSGEEEDMKGLKVINSHVMETARTDHTSQNSHVLENSSAAVKDVPMFYSGDKETREFRPMTASDSDTYSDTDSDTNVVCVQPAESEEESDGATSALSQDSLLGHLSTGS